ncbi:MAG: hypothetical protein CMF38_00510 [Legionellaceae bacterium]|nr:hypothetical protein [Legionellaceae bacterium]HAF86957.1 hypothetical protein [Legionellales bacterium]HCA88992.1 hypothetical protein [Legionellales bacterium]|tara:strand:- start:340 stop:1176 length:837 start_codon:yes stop_codon:yes gene_type:complete
MSVNIEHTDIIQLFRQFKHHLTQLNQHICHELNHLPKWIADTNFETLNYDEEHLLAALMQLAPQTEMPQATYACPGAVGCTHDTMQLITQLNQTKSEFKALIQQFLRVHQYDDTKIIRDLLKKDGHGLIKLKHVYRHIKVIDYHPRRIALGQSRSSSHRVISIDDAINLLNRTGQGAHIDIQIKQVQQLPMHSTLVILRKIPAHWVANISTFKDNAEGMSTTVKIKSSLPIFYIHDASLPMPVVEFAKKRSKEKQRSDKKLEDEAFLPSISAYRYSQA